MKRDNTVQKRESEEGLLTRQAASASMKIIDGHMHILQWVRKDGAPAFDVIEQYCEENGIEAKLHCLVYDKFTPDWLPKKDMAAMEKAYEERFRQISERYAGRLYEVEVIN